MAVISALEWLPVESRVFTAAAYRDDARQLYLRFRDGDIYRYFECSASEYGEFLAACSKGEYFSRHIRNQFRHERIHRNHGCFETTSESLEQQLNNSVLLAKARVQKRDVAHAAGVQE